ncbi:Aldo/keto reductase [Pholiota conissans]|uniref:Aldo/keto reductase n=1 Tax=Pholiota conissans TaxID=109636 RepID=A0A9P5Z751_9AGAR|nr:Aldo/keto reductase [Pholiota conissans]
MSPPLSISSTVKLSSGYEMPMLGVGVYLNEDPIPACEAALKHGYRHIDTAEMYGNEEAVGQAIRNSGVKREDIFITTKIGSELHDDAPATIDTSLKKLGVSYIDLYLIHDGMGGKEKRLKAYKALLDAKAAGKIRTVGVSNYAVRHLEEIREAGYEMPAVNQVELQPFCQQKDIVEYDKAHGIITSAYCPLIRAKFDNPVLQEVAKEVNKEVPQVLVRWSLQRGFVPLPKSAKPERVASNANVYDFELSPQQMAKIDALDQGTPGAISWNPIDAA